MKRVFYFFVVIAIAAITVFSQGSRSTIRGTVTDPNRAVVPNATVRLIDSQKGTEVRNTTTNGDGVYQFVEIEPSTYNVVIDAPNFKELKIKDITVEINRNLVLDATVTVGGVSTEVEVTAGAEVIDRESPTLGTTVERKRVEGLPLNGRNVLNLALLQPGVFPTGGTLSGLGIRVNGSRGTENNVTVDGANNNEIAVGGVIGGISRPDAVQEFRMLTSNFEAEFGRNTGSVINVVTRSGTNAYHGNARFFYRGTQFSAANFFDNALGAPGVDHRQPFDRKEYGFNIGGPVYFLNFGEGVPALYNGKDKTFFFFDYERRWQKLGGSVALTNLPSAAQRAGNFSGLNPIYDPATGTAANPGGTAFAGNVIPTNRISPIAKYYLQFIPQANAQGQALATSNTLSLVNYYTFRFDHNFNSRNLLNFTFNRSDTNTSSDAAFGGTNIPGFGSKDLRKADNYVGKYTTILSSNLINTFLFSYSVNNQPGVAPVNKMTPAAIGFTADFVADPTWAGPPDIRFYDSGFELGNTIQGPQVRVSENFQFQDSVSWVVGNHRIKFGADFVRYRQKQDFLFVNQGIFGYSAVGEEGSNTVGNDFADFLIGNTPITVQYGNAGHRDWRQSAWAGFVQDNWRASQNLSLSFGLRYEFNSPLTDTKNRVAYYRVGPGITSQHLAAGDLIYNGKRLVAGTGGGPNGVVYVGDNDPALGGKVPDGGVKLDKNNFAPRFGIAYSLGGGSGFLGRIIGKDQTVIRGGIGLYYGAIIGDTSLQQLNAPGYSGASTFLYHPSGLTANGGFGPDPYPNYRYLNGPEVLSTLANPFVSTSDIVVATTLSSIQGQVIDPLIETPVVTQYNATIERSFLKDYVLSVSYVGNIGRKLYVQRLITPSVGTLIPASARFVGPAIAAPSTGNANKRRVNDNIRGGVNQLTTMGKSQYDGLEANLQKRFANDGLTFQLAYTFSKSMNDSDTARGGIDILNQRAGWARSSDDAPHRFVGSFIYELPFFKSTGGVLNRIVDGWSVGAIYTYQSGTLFSVGNPIDTTGTGGGIVSNIDINKPIVFTDPRTNPTRRAFNADAFIAADCRVINQTTGALVTGQNYDLCINADGTKGRRGTLGRNVYRLNNPTNNWDAIVTKRVKLWSESSNLELRFEAFNLLNHTQFTGINLSYLTGPTTIAGAFNPNYKANTNAAFGTYTSAGQGRSIQFGARLNF